MNNMPFNAALLGFYQNNRRLVALTLLALLTLVVGLSYARYTSRLANEALRTTIAQEAASGVYATAEKAMREQADVWLDKELSVTEYLKLFDDGKLLVVGLPNGSGAKSANPYLYAVTRDGELGYVVDTWRGSLTDQSMKAQSSQLHVVTVMPPEVSDRITLADGVRVGIQLLLLGGLLLFTQGMLPGANGFKPVRQVKTKFDDVIGAKEAKAALRDIVDYLKNPEGYAKVGARPSCGVLLYGPPGTGKTLLAKALAGECGVSFIACSGSEFTSKFLGVGVAKVKSLFARARKEGACIVFIDELDGIGKRAGGDNPATSESNRIINQFLIELDGFASDSRVILIGATNLAENVDPALLREGRFDRKIGVALPDVVEREALARHYSQTLRLGDDIDFPQLARLTLGLSPAAIASLANQAALRAVRDQAAAVGMLHMREALETVHLGEESNSPLLPADRERTAIHEAGHALAAVLRKSGTVEKVTIIPRAAALGVTFITHEDAVRLQTQSALNHRLDVLLAGRCAEELVLGDVSSGASSDLQHATNLATDMLTKYGLGEGLAVLDQDQLKSGVALDRINELLKQRYAATKELLAAHRVALVAVSDLLLQQETIEGERVRELALAA